MKKILVVDNDEVIVEFMNDVLKKEGHQVVTAQDGLAALDLLKNYTPDIIFLDLVMPYIGGKKLCEVIRGTDKIKNAFIIILSAVADEEGADILAMGADAFIAKGPFDEMAKNIPVVLNQNNLSPSQREFGNFPRTGNIKERGIANELLSIKRHFEIIMERMSEGVLEITANGRIVFANAKAISFIRVSEHNLLGSDFVELFGKNDRLQVAELIKTMGDGTKEMHEGLPVSLGEYRLMMTLTSIYGEGLTALVILKDVTRQKRVEEVLRQQNRMLGFRNKESQAFNFLLEELVSERTADLTRTNAQLTREIAERHRAEAKLKNAYDKLKEIQNQLIQHEKMAAMGRLASGLAHQIRNPLEIILMGAEFLNNTLLEKNEIAEKSIEKIIQAIDRTNRIVTDFLRLSRKSEFKFETMDIHRLLDETISLINHRAMMNRINMKRQYSENVLPLDGDRNMLQQVFLNLLTNALDAMPEKGEIRIATYNEIVRTIGASSGYRSSDYFQIGEEVVVIEVKDTGTGIPIDMLSKIFEPFFTTKDVEKGTGLGLSVAHSIIDQHHGSIDVESIVDKGTKFIIRLHAAKH